MNYHKFYFLLSIFYFLFSAIRVAYAHEEGATSITPDNITGPLLTLIIIVLAVVVAKRISAGGGSAKGEKNIKIATNKYD